MSAKIENTILPSNTTFATNLTFPGTQKENSIEYSTVSSSSVTEVDVIEPALCTNLTLRDISEVGIKVSEVSQVIFKIVLQNGTTGNAEILFAGGPGSIFGSPANFFSSFQTYVANLSTPISSIQATFQNTSKVNLFYSYVKKTTGVGIATVYQGNPYTGNYKKDGIGNWIELTTLEQFKYY